MGAHPFRSSALCLRDVIIHFLKKGFLHVIPTNLLVRDTVTIGIIIAGIALAVPVSVLLTRVGHVDAVILEGIYIYIFFFFKQSKFNRKMKKHKIKRLPACSDFIRHSPICQHLMESIFKVKVVTESFHSNRSNKSNWLGFECERHKGSPSKFCLASGNAFCGPSHRVDVGDKSIRSDVQEGKINLSFSHLSAVGVFAFQLLIGVSVNVRILSAEVSISSPADSTLGRTMKPPNVE